MDYAPTYPNSGQVCKTPHIGYKLSAEHRRKISEAMKGRVFSEEHKRKLSENHRKYNSDEHRRKISEAMKGRKVTEGHKRAVSEGKIKGWKNIPNEMRKKMASHLHTPEVRKKVGDILKGRKVTWGDKISKSRKEFLARNPEFKKEMTRRFVEGGLTAQGRKIVFDGMVFYSSHEIKCYKFLRRFFPECQIEVNKQVGSNPIDFFVADSFFWEHHATNWDRRSKKEYFGDRREILDKNGYADYPLILTTSLGELNGELRNEMEKLVSSQGGGVGLG